MGRATEPKQRDTARSMRGSFLACDEQGAIRATPNECLRKLAILGGVALYACLRAPSATEPAMADGDTRTLTFVNRHTNETASFTFRANGYYDQAELDKLNWYMRDWRLNEPTKMDPHLFDIIWEVYRQAGSSQPIDVLSAYRSPQTNAMLRRRSRQVAEHSQHMQGKAIDAHFLDVSTGVIRDVAMRMQEGGVGFYPIGSTPWVHIDSGAVRYWPRMGRTALARLFPDGKTVFIPADGQPMERYAEAKAMIESRGGDVQTAQGGGNFFSWLFGGARGGGADDDEESGGAAVIASSGRGGFAMASGRGGAVAVAAAAPEPPPAPAPVAPAPTPAPVAPEPAALEPAASATEPHAPESADADIPPEPARRAPLPPKKPGDLFAALDAPMPHRRPLELALVPPSAKSGDSGDIIATLIERNALPTAITKGVKPAPKSALAMVETRSDRLEPDAALARAATLTMPPMPPARPRGKDDGVTKAERAPPVPPLRPSKTKPQAANPYGALVVDAFAAPHSPQDAAKALRDLRGSSP